MPRRIFVNLESMAFHDPIRGAEFVNGLAAFLVGIWIWKFFWPATPELAVTLWTHLSPGIQAAGMTAAGLVQALTAGSMRVQRLRTLAAAAATAGWAHLAVSFFLVQREAIGTPLLFLAAAVSGWVLVRTLFDQRVNGSDRRGRLPSMDPEGIAAVEHVLTQAEAVATDEEAR
jgi:hypothetical protein